MKRIVGVIDEAPFDPRTWSGSSRFFFEALNRKQALTRAIDAETSKASRHFHQLLNFDPNLKKWKFKFHLDTSYYAQMTKVVKAKIAEISSSDFEVILQIGAWYDTTSIAGKTKASYHDGNLSALLNSPYGHPKISNRFITRALAYERQLYSRLDLIFPMSNWLADSFMKDFGVPAKKIFPVGAGINLPRINNTETRSYEEKTILMVGKDFERKGGYVLLDAFKKIRSKFPEAKLKIVGPQLQQLPDGVECIGYIDKRSPDGLQKILDLYSSATVFALPSLYEPFGIAFAEAMAHRLPCVGAKSCAMPEIIIDGVSGFVVPPGDSVSLANAISELLASSSLCKQMGQAGYDHYLANFTWDVVVDKILNTINSY